MTKNHTTLLLVVAFGVLIGALFRGGPIPKVDVRFGSELPFNADRNTGGRPGGEELVLAFVGTPKCGACNHPDLIPLVTEAITGLRSRSAETGTPLVTVGISPVWAPAEGMRFLSSINTFDEVVTGRSWLNSELVDLAWDYPNADVATPQIIVYRQSVVAPGDSVRASITRNPPIVRATGVLGIRDWVEAGMPFNWRN